MISFQVAQSNAERDSENLTEDLLAGKIENIDEFLEIFMVSLKEFSKVLFTQT